MFLQKGDGQELPRTKPSRQNSPEKKQGQKSHETRQIPLEDECMYAYTAKNLGGPICVTYYWGGTEMCDKVFTGRVGGGHNWTPSACLSVRRFVIDLGLM